MKDVSHGLTERRLTAFRVASLLLTDKEITARGHFVVYYKRPYKYILPTSAFLLACC